MTDEQKPTTEAAPVPCPNCGADVLDTGYIVESITYQGYIRVAGKMVKSYKLKSQIHTPHCALCRASLTITVDALKAAA